MSLKKKITGMRHVVETQPVYFKLDGAVEAVPEAVITYSVPVSERLQAPAKRRNSTV